MPFRTLLHHSTYRVFSSPIYYYFFYSIISCNRAIAFHYGTFRTSFGIGNHHGTVTLHNVDYSICPAFSCTGTAHHKDIQVSFMFIAVQSHAEVLG